MLWSVVLAAGSGLGQSNPQSLEPPGTNLTDHGVFIISMGGKQVGTETFEIRSTADKIEARAEIHLRLQQKGKTLDLRTSPDLVLDSGLRPLTYSWKQKGSQSSRLEVDFRTSPAKTRYTTVSGEEDRREFVLPDSVVVLDDNVVHHYQLVVDRYRLTAGGHQTFSAFVPQEATPGVLEVQDAGTEAETIGKSTVNLRHLLVTTELAQIGLWIDPQNRLRRISIPAEDLEAVREK